jgi:type IV secretion system protein VirB9/ComB9 competence protein
MKKFLILLLPILLVSDSIFVDDPSTNSPNNNQVFENTNQNINLDAIQKSFLETSNSSILNIKYEQNKTYRVQTRLLMNTMIILNEDKIAGNPYFGNSGFTVTKLGVGKYDFSNIVLIQPKYNGIDTNLTILGESGNVYSFYLYSTDHTSKSIPNTVVFVSEEKSKIDKINIVNLEKEQFNLENSSKTKESTISDPDYFYIGEGKNRIKVYKSQVINDFVQDGAEELKAKEIFRDNKFVYFKYDKDYSLSSFPALFKVVDGFDSPINFRVVGDYLVAETIANKFTLKIENKHVCVRRLKDVNNEKK